MDDCDCSSWYASGAANTNLDFHAKCEPNLQSISQSIASAFASTIGKPNICCSSSNTRTIVCAIVCAICIAKSGPKFRYLGSNSDPNCELIVRTFSIADTSAFICCSSSNTRTFGCSIISAVCIAIIISYSVTD